MIVFIPAHDAQTTDNLAVVSSILPENAVLLVAQQATRQQLLTHFESHNTLFAMSHGTSEAIWENDDTPAFNLSDITRFSDSKRVYVFACFTANELGEAFKNQGSVYWGYTGRVQSPNSEQVKVHIFQRIFTHILTYFPLCTTIESIKLSLVAIKNLCDRADAELDEIDPTDLESRRAILDIWNRLRIKHFELAESILHPEAQVGDLLF